MNSQRLLTLLAAALLLPLVLLPCRALAQGEPAAPPAPTDALDDPIRLGDLLRVTVAGPEGAAFSGDFRVDTEGNITLPGVQQIQVKGLTRARIAEMLSQKLTKGKFLKRADVVVTILARKLREVVINGAVQNSGRVALRDGALLSDILGAALPLAQADLARITITRGDHRLVVNYRIFLAGRGDGMEHNPPLEAGDRIYVYAGEQPGGTIRLRGEVKEGTRVLIPITEGTTAGQVLQSAGGITDFADRAGIFIQRGDERIALPYDEIQKGLPGRDIRLQDKDEIVVPRLERPHQYSVTGAVSRPGAFPLATRVTLLDAIGQAGGLQDGAKRQAIQIRRKTAAGPIKTLAIDFRRDQDAATEIQDGDVIDVPFGPRRPSLDIGQVLGILSSIAFIVSQVRR